MDEVQGGKRVFELPKVVSSENSIKKEFVQKRVVAYCRVSTKQEEQLNSYETQKAAYEDMIHRNPDWKLVKIFADKGITGTSVKNRDEFNRMIRLCKLGKVDMIITKSISRFARNTEDCLHYTRLLKEYGVDVYFEEQKIHSTQPGAEFYITIYGSIAQSESENISANVRWGKEQSAKQGKVPFQYKNFLGYKKGTEGKPEIVEEEAKVIKFIYDRYLAGDALSEIAEKLESLKILSPSGKEKWRRETIRSILKNERYKGDAIINKTYVVDCISKKVKVNQGERKKYYVANNHPAIIDAMTYGRVQEEMARRTSLAKSRQSAKTEIGKYSGKFALTGKLICGECKSQYRRCTWSKRGAKKKVWRCINRVDYGARYCHHSPTIEEGVLHEAIMDAIQQVAMQDAEVLKVLKEHIAMGIGAEDKEESTVELELRVAQIDAEFKAMIDAVSADTIDGVDETKMQQLLIEKNELMEKLNQIAVSKEQDKKAGERMNTIFPVIDGLKNHPITYDDEIVRQLIDCVVVESKEQIKIIFRGGLQVGQEIKNSSIIHISAQRL